MTTTNFSDIKKALRLFSHKNVDKKLAHANARKYLNAMYYLGDKHLLAKPVQRLLAARSH